MDLDFRNVNSLWCSVLVETLVQAGLRQAVISPGSRSAPLVIALARHPEVEAIPVLDERSAAFFALGLARQRNRPVLLVCTSGTAGANYFPAVIEARESGVPLLIITADRPPEMRACASGQTIDQQKLFGAFPNFYHELALPEITEPLLRYLRQTVAHACARTVQPFAGPVHLNAPFRDPLAPVEDGTAGRWAQAIAWADFFKHLAPPAAGERGGGVAALPATPRGIIVAGPAQPADPASYAKDAAVVARKLGWPVLADGLSPLRQHASSVPHLVTTYDALLRDPALGKSLRPEAVLCLGGWPTSKVLRGWLEETAGEIIMVTEHPDNRDPLHGRTQALPLSLHAFASGLSGTGATGEFAQRWTEGEQRIRARLDQRLQAEAGFFEPKAAWLLARHLPAGTPVFVANSMPARDVEYVWPAGDRQLRPYCNRGGNGIDGTLSTALGVAHGGSPAVLLTGDLALLHDTNGFLLRPKFRGSLTIVLINNRGGGIFEHLPVAKFNPPFEEFFATPQEADFSKLGAAYGVEHILVRGWDQFAGLVAQLPSAGIRLLEIRTDRKKDAAMRRELFAAAAGN